MGETTKAQRLRHANALIGAISRHGRRFFYSQKHDRVSRFEIDIAGQLWLRDKHTWKRCYTAYRYNWRHFTEGGTLRRLIDALAVYIRTGVPIHRGHFGPWPAHFCEGDLWGYGAEAMTALRAEIADSPCLRPAPSNIDTLGEVG